MLNEKQKDIFKSACYEQFVHGDLKGLYDSYDEHYTGVDLEEFLADEKVVEAVHTAVGEMWNAINDAADDVDEPAVEEIVEVAALSCALVDFAMTGDVDHWDDHFDVSVAERVRPIVDANYETMIAFGKKIRKRLVAKAQRLLKV